MLDRPAPPELPMTRPAVPESLLPAARACACLAVALALAAGTPAADARRPDGGHRIEASPSDDISPELERRITEEVQRGVAKLQAAGALPPPDAAPKVSGLAWPLGATPGAGFDRYGISGFVDLDLRTPGLVRDYMCGARTYDTAAGYNHGGIDYIPWPFPWYLMDTEPVEIRAAAAGTLVARADGVYDRACNWDGLDATNFVAIRHADGTIARYLHMKKGTVTTRPVGAFIAAGELIGRVGSSGISKVPHLHFELRASSVQGAPVIEPHAGTCNAGPSAWQTQPPYRAPILTRLSTHSQTPDYPTCPNTVEKPYLQDDFVPGAKMTVVAAYRDARVGLPTAFRVVDARGAVVASWPFDPAEDEEVTTEYVSGAWWNWEVSLPADAPHGLGFVEAVHAGKTVRHPYRVGDTTTAIGDMKGLIGAWFEPATAGQGFELHWINGDMALLFFYGHHDDGTNFFLLGQRVGAWDFGQEIEFSMYRTTGGRWNGLDPAQIQRPTWGTLRVTFVDCEHAVAELDGEDGTKVLALERLGRTEGLDCG